MKITSCRTVKSIAAAILLACGCSRSDERSPMVYGATKDTPENRRFIATYAGRMRVAADETTMLRLKEKYVHMNEAYFSGNLAAVETFFASPDIALDSMPRNQLDRILKLVDQMLDYKLLDEDLLHHIEKVEDYKAIVSAKFQLARWRMDLMVRRREYDYFMAYREARILKMLQMHKNAFHRRGRADFEVLATGFYEDWVMQIESDDGHTHQYMRYLKAWAGRIISFGVGEMNSEIRAARAKGAVWLVKDCGYTPKWLDEEFPLPEGEKDAWEK